MTRAERIIPGEALDEDDDEAREAWKAWGPEVEDARDTHCARSKLQYASEASFFASVEALDRACSRDARNAATLPAGAGRRRA